MSSSNWPTPQFVGKNNATHVLWLMQRAGFTLQHSGREILRATKRSGPPSPAQVAQVENYFRNEAIFVPDGLATLPACWLTALPGILEQFRQPHWIKLPWFIHHITVMDGLLVLQFRQELHVPTAQITRWDQIRIAVNAGVYPNRWQP